MKLLQFLLQSKIISLVLASDILYTFEVQVSHKASKANLFALVYGKHGQTDGKQLNEVDHYFAPKSTYRFNNTAVDVGKITNFGVWTDEKTEFIDQTKLPTGPLMPNLHFNYFKIEVPSRGEYYFIESGTVYVDSNWGGPRPIFNYSIPKPNREPSTSNVTNNPQTEYSKTLVIVIYTTASSSSTSTNTATGPTKILPRPKLLYIVMGVMSLIMCCILCIIAIFHVRTTKKQMKLLPETGEVNEERRGSSRTAKPLSECSPPLISSDMVTADGRSQ